MSVTSGFYNSLNGDRKYNSEQMSAIFDGIINDGIFANIGTAFTVSANGGNNIAIGVGRAWFNSSWVYNDAILPMTLEVPEVVLNRIDAVVIEVNHTHSVRNGTIKVVKGTPSSTPVRPTLTDEDDIHQHPLAYIYRTANANAITQADITSMIGTSSCPYITGILQVQNIDNIVAQWHDQWNQWFANETGDDEAEASQWMTQMKADFELWFSNLQIILDDNTAATMASQIVELQSRFDTLALERCVYDTLEDSTGDIVKDNLGTVIEGKTVFPSGNEQLNEIQIDHKAHLDDKNNPHNVTAEQAGALPLTGGKLTGDLVVDCGTEYKKVFMKRDINTGSQVEGVTSEFGVSRMGTNEYGAVLRTAKAETDEEIARILVGPELLYYKQDNGSLKSFAIYGEHNTAKIYRSLGELGLDTPANITPAAIANAMANNSIAIFQTSLASTFPNINPPNCNYPTFIVSKMASSVYVGFLAIDASGFLWSGRYNSGSSVTWSGWYRQLNNKSNAFIHHSALVKGTNPSAITSRMIVFNDSDDPSVANASGGIESIVKPDGTSQIIIRAYKNTAGSTANANIVIQYNTSSSTALVSGSDAPVGSTAFRNILAGTSDMTAGTSSLATGRIYLVYE